MSFFNQFLGVFSNGVNWSSENSNIGLWYTSTYGLPTKQSLGGTIIPVQFQRLKADIQSWRDALMEAENPYYPHRVRLQRIYMDNILNPHIYACMERRRDLTRLREFKVISKNDDTLQYLDVEKYFNSTWFRNFITYVIDAQFFGYSLISLGDIINDSFYKLNVVRRWNISPDREIVSTFVYLIDGVKFLNDTYDLSLRKENKPNSINSLYDENDAYKNLPKYDDQKMQNIYQGITTNYDILDQNDVSDWHIWVTTPNELGYGICGYGLLNNISPYAIWLRRLEAYNMTYAELFGQPYRIAKTNKEGKARTDLFNALKNSGASATAVIGLEDEIEYLQSNAGSDTVFSDLEDRMHSKISKIILGSSDILDPTSGKLGNDNTSSPAQKALDDKQSYDGLIVQNIINEQLIPRMRKLGFNIPDDAFFVWQNNKELNKAKNDELDIKNKFAQFMLSMHNAGLHVPSEYAENELGIENIVDNMQMQPMYSNADINKAKASEVSNKIQNLYGK